MNEDLPKISLVIIHYKTPDYLTGCLEAIFKQTYKNIEVIFIDNASMTKEAIKFMKKKYENKNIKIVHNSVNSGYSGAANQGIRMAIDGMTPQEATINHYPQDYLPQADFKPADYVVITNPDILYSPSYFEKAVHRMEKDPKIAALTGKVYKYDFANNQSTKIIDTTGLFAYKNRRIIDRGQGLEDKGQFNKEQEVFGVSGACPIYRASALKDVQVMGEYLDEDFFMYKEDVDLSWRFLLYGYKNLYYPKAIAFHGRGTGIHKRFSNIQLVKNRRHLSKFQKHYSFRNQLLMESKNELTKNFWQHFFPIMFKRIGGLIYITFVEPHLWKSYMEYLKLRPAIRKKRLKIMKSKKVEPSKMKGWFKKRPIYKR